MWTQPTAQQRPEPFHGIHMHFTKTVAIFVSRKFTPSMVDMLMPVAPGLQTGINAVLIRINQGPRNDGVLYERLDRLLLHISQQLDDHLPTPLDHPKDGWSFFLQCAPATFAFASASPAFAAFLFHHFRLSFMPSDHIGFIALYLVGQRQRSSVSIPN